jgi:glycosyltransferase involved in cell wall biosynthesis
VHSTSITSSVALWAIAPMSARVSISIEMQQAAKQTSAPSDVPISVLILTRNEARHIERSVTSARRLTAHVFVADSDSTDGTADLARAAGAQVVAANFERFADKLNWCADNIAFSTPWILRLDADEVLTDELVKRLPSSLAAVAPNVSGIYLRRQLWFMGRWIRHGGMYPTYSMRLWRRGLVSCEIRDLDEHMVLRSGETTTLPLDVIDDPLFDLSTWIEKHNRYASLEARSATTPTDGDPATIQARLLGTMPERARWMKVKIFYRLPLFVRPLLYFAYRYFLRWGFLDGSVGFAFHFMHGLWYRMLVDAKILEARRGRGRL